MQIFSKAGKRRGKLTITEVKIVNRAVDVLSDMEIIDPEVQHISIAIKQLLLRLDAKNNFQTPDHQRKLKLIAETSEETPPKEQSADVSDAISEEEYEALMEVNEPVSVMEPLETEGKVDHA